MPGVDTRQALYVVPYGDGPAVVTNSGQTTIYYSAVTPLVSATVNDGSLAAGQVLTITQGTWLLSSDVGGYVGVTDGAHLGAAVADGPANVPSLRTLTALDGRYRQFLIGEKRPEDYGAKGDGVILYNAVMTAASAVLNSTDSFVSFTSGDVGKTIIVSGVAASNESLVTTIQSVQSPSQCTLAAAATVNSPDPAGRQLAVYGTDDTAAIQQASDAAAASNGTVVFDSEVYIANGALQQGGTRKANSQITLPNGGYKGGMGRLVWRGARDATGLPFPPFPTATGTVIVSTLVGQAYSPTYGVPSVVGGPTREQLPANWSGWFFGCENITLLTPRNPSLSAFNLERTSSKNSSRVVAGTLEWGYPLSSQEALTIGAPSHPQACAFIEPMHANQQGGSGLDDGIHTWGYFAGICPAEWTHATSMLIHSTRLPIAIRSGFDHHAKFEKLGIQASPYLISGWDPTQSTPTAAIVAVPAAPNSPGGNGLNIDSLDIEDFSDATIATAWAVLATHINDQNNTLAGRIRHSRWSWVNGAFTPEGRLTGVSANMIAETNMGRPDGCVLARAVKDPGGGTSQAMTQGVWTAIDATNLSLTFIAPAWAQVEVEIEFLCALAGTAPYSILVGCVDGSGNYVAGTGQAVSESEASGVVRRVRSKKWVFSGLTPGNSYTWRAAYYLPTAGETGTIYYGGSTVTGNTAFPNGQIAFTLRALGNNSLSN